MMGIDIGMLLIPSSWVVIMERYLEISVVVFHNHLISVRIHISLNIISNPKTETSSNSIVLNSDTIFNILIYLLQFSASNYNF